MRFCFAASLMSCGSSPSALSIMARKVLLEIFQAIETPFSSTLPPCTVNICQNLRRAMRALQHGELAVEHPHVAGGILRGLEQALVDLALAIDSAGADGSWSPWQRCRPE